MSQQKGGQQAAAAEGGLIFGMACGREESSDGRELYQPRLHPSRHIHSL